MPLPDWSLRRDLTFRTFDDALAEVDRLLARPYERRGNWDLAQACDHLADAFDGSLRGFSFAAPWFIRALFGKLGLWYVLRYRSIPIRPRMPKDQEPVAGKNPQACVARLRESIRSFEASQAAPAMHPFFGRISHEQWRQVHLFHTAHHLAFLHPLDTDAMAPSR
jgi:hypothetical protein